jgi:hypothetical protein
MFNKKQENQVKSREERFKLVASRRVQEILNKMRLLRNCANTSNYEYSQEQIEKIFKAIDEEWKNVKLEFNKHQTKHKEFKL